MTISNSSDRASLKLSRFFLRKPADFLFLIRQNLGPNYWLNGRIALAPSARSHLKGIWRKNLSTSTIARVETLLWKKKLRETKKKEIRKLPKTVQKLQIGVSNLEKIRSFLKHIGSKLKPFTHSLAAIIMYHSAFILSKHLSVNMEISVADHLAHFRCHCQPSHRGLELEVIVGCTLVCIAIADPCTGQKNSALAATESSPLLEPIFLPAEAYWDCLRPGRRELHEIFSKLSLPTTSKEIFEKSLGTAETTRGRVRRGERPVFEWCFLRGFLTESAKECFKHLIKPPLQTKMPWGPEDLLMETKNPPLQ